MSAWDAIANLFTRKPLDHQLMKLVIEEKDKTISSLIQERDMALFKVKEFQERMANTHMIDENCERELAQLRREYREIVEYLYQKINESKL